MLEHNCDIMSFNIICNFHASKELFIHVSYTEAITAKISYSQPQLQYSYMQWYVI